MTGLHSHPALERWNPARRKLVHMGAPLSPALNPFADHGVDILPAFLYTDTFNSKAPVAYELVVDGILSGGITPETTVGGASSGNTGLNLALLCKALNLPCEIIMQSDTPASKIDIIRMLGNPIRVLLLNEGTVAYARKRGTESGYYNADQYGNPANIAAQRKYFAPQLYAANDRRIDVLVASGGTLGTAAGPQEYARQHGITTKVVIGVCAEGQEVPAARTASKIRRDVTIASLEDFFCFRTAERHDAFLASYAMFSEVEWIGGGPTSGLALFVALRFIQEHIDAKTLDQFRGPDGRIRVVFVCPDDYRPYAGLYLSTLNFSQFSSASVSTLLYEAVRNAQ